MRKVIIGMMAVLLCGCGVKAPIEGRADPHAVPQISFADADLANQTAILPPIVERKDGLLHVSVPIRSASDYDLHVDYRYTFLNESGAPIEQTGWIGHITITRNSYYYLKINSASASAADFHIQLRYAQ